MQFVSYNITESSCTYLYIHAGPPSDPGTEGDFNDMHACMPVCIVILCLAIAMGIINCHMACNLSLTISLNPLVHIYIYMQARLLTPELKVNSMTYMHVCLHTIFCLAIAMGPYN